MSVALRAAAAMPGGYVAVLLSSAFRGACVAAVAAPGDHGDASATPVSAVHRLLLLRRFIIEISMRPINGRKEAQKSRKLSSSGLCVSCAFSWLSSQHLTAASIVSYRFPKHSEPNDRIISRRGAEIAESFIGAISLRPPRLCEG